jgi:hypothetical protein
MWLFYLLIAVFVIKTIYDLAPPNIMYTPRVPDPPPLKNDEAVAKAIQAIHAAESRQFHMTLDKMLESYAPDVSDPKDVIALSMQGSGIHLMPMFLTKEAAEIFQAKEKADNFDSAFFGADDLMEQLGIEDGDAIVDATDYIFYEDLHEIDVSTNKGGATFLQPNSEAYKFDEIKIGQIVAAETDWYMENYEYCLLYHVSCSKGLANFEYRYTEEELNEPRVTDELTYDAQNIYYNGYNIHIEGFEWEYVDWWNPIGYTLLPVEKIKEITMGDLW